jgi:hypothetical protein
VLIALGVGYVGARAFPRWARPGRLTLSWRSRPSKTVGRHPHVAILCAEAALCLVAALACAIGALWLAPARSAGEVDRQDGPMELGASLAGIFVGGER